MAQGDTDSDSGEGYVAYWTGGPKATINGLNDMVKQGNDHEDRISALENESEKSSPFKLDICMNGVPTRIIVSAMVDTVNP